MKDRETPDQDSGSSTSSTSSSSTCSSSTSTSSQQGAPLEGVPIQSSFPAGGSETQEDVSEMNVKQQLSRAAVVGLPVLAFGPLAAGCANRMCRWC